MFPFVFHENLWPKDLRKFSNDGKTQKKLLLNQIPSKPQKQNRHKIIFINEMSLIFDCTKLNN